MHDSKIQREKKATTARSLFSSFHLIDLPGWSFPMGSVITCQSRSTVLPPFQINVAYDALNGADNPFTTSGEHAVHITSWLAGTDNRFNKAEAPFTPAAFRSFVPARLIACASRLFVPFSRVNLSLTR